MAEIDKANKLIRIAVRKMATFLDLVFRPSWQAPACRTSARIYLRSMGVALSVWFGGCQSDGRQDITGTISGNPQEERLPPAEALGRLYDRNPDNKQVALNYARALHDRGEYAQAAAILQRLSIRYSRDPEVLAAYGKALAEAGRAREAAAVLENAHSPERPNWSVLSAQGAVADQLGDHEQAQAYYQAALKIAPGQPHVLSNLGLSYALSRKLPEAEAALRQAAAAPDADRLVRQNLALVLALEGKFASAEETGRRDLDPKEASANVAAIRRMLPQSNTSKSNQLLDSGSQAGGKARPSSE